MLSHLIVDLFTIFIIILGNTRFNYFNFIEYNVVCVLYIQDFFNWMNIKLIYFNWCIVDICITWESVSAASLQVTLIAN